MACGISCAFVWVVHVPDGDSATVTMKVRPKYLGKTHIFSVEFQFQFIWTIDSTAPAQSIRAFRAADNRRWHSVIKSHWNGLHRIIYCANVIYLFNRNHSRIFAHLNQFPVRRIPHQAIITWAVISSLLVAARRKANDNNVDTAAEADIIPYRVCENLVVLYFAWK